MTLTYLLKKIQNKVWGEVIRHLETEDGFQEAQILHDGELCLHHALRLDPPLDAIQKIIAAYPGAVNYVGKYGMFPLHIAVKYRNKQDVIDQLLRWNIDALTVRNDIGETPLDYNYVDKNGMFQRPTACWKRQNDVDTYLERREKAIVSMEKYVVEVDSLQQKKKKDCSLLDEKYKELHKTIKEDIQKTESSFGTFMEALVGIQDDIDEFVDRVNGRISKIDEEINNWDQKSKNEKKDRDSNLGTWYHDMKALKDDLEKLQIEFKSNIRASPLSVP
jgi:hypothetical protein